ncbi:MAG: hypothetical protein KQH57_15425 [Actinomycetales bacterium]|nr:hypothetical protein [Actinomycetales bacterium]
MTWSSACTCPSPTSRAPPAAVNSRKYLVRASHLDDLVALGSLTSAAARTPAAARFLAAAVAAGLNVLVSAPTRAAYSASAVRAGRSPSC